MTNAIIIMNVGTWLLALAAIPQILSIWEHRHDLRGYSKIASASLLLGLLLIDVAFLLVGDYISMAAGIIQVFMWLLATIYTKS